MVDLSLFKKIVHKILDFILNIYCRAVGYRFPTKYNWAWKLEMFLQHYERETTNLFKEKIERGGVIIDLGAHIGYFTSLFSELVGKNGKVYAFEPNPELFVMLKQNTRKFENVVLSEMAVSNKGGVINFYESLNNTGNHSIFPADFREVKISVNSVRLDDVIKEKVDWIKMDIEGAEPLAIEGMNRIISENQNIKLVIEFCPDILNLTNYTPKQFIGMIYSMGFKVYAITENGLKEITKDNNQNGIYHLTKHFINIFCIRD